MGVSSDHADVRVRSRALTVTINRTANENTSDEWS